MVSDTILVDVTGPVGIITLNRPEKRNALTMAMREQLSTALDDFGRSPAVRVVVLQGTAPAFCSGVDLTEWTRKDEGPVEVPSSVSSPFEAFSKPIFASVNGTAAGGGFEIALACDFIIASTTAQFLLPEVRIGSLPGAGGTQRLVQSLPRGVAARMLLSGDAIDATVALQYGLVTQVVARDALESYTLELAGRIAANAPLSLLAVKQCLRKSANSPLDEGIAFERELWFELSKSDDRAEGRAAFREGRSPDFQGK